MRLYLVTDGGREVWLAAGDGLDMYSYVPETGRFHLNDGLGDDFVTGGGLTYTPIGVTEARRLIERRVGSVAAPERRDLLDHFRADPSPLDVDAVFAKTLG
jgi:hypothetical protein